MIKNSGIFFIEKIMNINNIYNDSNVEFFINNSFSELKLSDIAVIDKALLNKISRVSKQLLDNLPVGNFPDADDIINLHSIMNTIEYI